MVQEVKRKTAKVKEAAIESKDQRWHCRNRVSLVFGSNHIEELETYLYDSKGLNFRTVQFHQAKSKAIEEILDNCIDEFYRGHVTEIHTTLAADGKTVAVQDNGIGFAVEKIKDVYTEFRTGSKFADEDVDEKGFLYRTLGQNGLGASATCLTSDSFKVTVRHYNTKNEQTYEFLDGALQIKKSKPKKFKGPSGVKVEFVLAKEVYKNNIVDKELLRKRIIDLAYNNPGLTFYFNGEKHLYKKGLFELAQRISPEQTQLFGEESYVQEGANARGKKYKAKFDLHLSLVLNNRSEERERMISFVNSTPTYDGGFHHDRIKRLFINSLKEKLEKTAKKDKIQIVDNDILAGMTFIIGIVMPNPRFESQTKRKLVRDAFLEKSIESFMQEGVEKFMRKNKEYLEQVMERARSRQRFMDLKDASKLAKKGKKQRIEKLLDANERKDRSKCTLFICEGDSAIGGLRSARDKLYQGGIALKGKPMNVSQASIKEVIENQEFADIMASIGLVIGQKVEPKDLRYTKIVFLADSDVDGGHINTLLTNFFFTFWPDLFQLGMVQVAKAPLFEVITDKGTTYCETQDDLEKMKVRKDIKIKEIQRNKGLGEMSQEAFKHVLQRKDWTKITVKDMKAAAYMLETCFGKESQLRKDLLIDSDDIEVDLDNIVAGKKARAAAAKKAQKGSRV
jgi:DNA gyrase subunit B